MKSAIGLRKALNDRADRFPESEVRDLCGDDRFGFETTLEGYAPVAIRPPTDSLIAVNHLAVLRLTGRCRKLANHAKLIGLGFTMTNSLSKRSVSRSVVNRRFTNPLKAAKTSFPYLIAILCCYRVTMLDTVHARAICEEIGYRLRQALPVNNDDLPPRLQGLMRELVLLDCAAPSLVPSSEDMVAAPEPAVAA